MQPPRCDFAGCNQPSVATLDYNNRAHTSPQEPGVAPFYRSVQKLNVCHEHNDQTSFMYGRLKELGLVHEASGLLRAVPGERHVVVE